MTLAELKEAVRAYGYRVYWGDPAHPWWRTYLRVPTPGHGNPVAYTMKHVRLLVAWYAWRDLTSPKDQSPALVWKAARLTARSEGGWVCISNRKVAWTLDPPVDLLPFGVACIRTPEWKETPVGASNPISLRSGL